MSPADQPSALPRVNIRAAGNSSCRGRSTHGTGTRGLSTDARKAQRRQREGAPRQILLPMRTGQRPTGRSNRGLFVPHQDGREHSPTMRATGSNRRWSENDANHPRSRSCSTANRSPRSSPCVWGRPRGALRTGRYGCWRAGSSSWAVVESISHETIRRTLKKTDAAENRVLGDPGMLDLYQKPYDPDCPVVADEQPVASGKPVRRWLPGVSVFSAGHRDCLCAARRSPNCASSRPGHGRGRLAIRNTAAAICLICENPTRPTDRGVSRHARCKLKPLPA